MTTKLVTFYQKYRINIAYLILLIVALVPYINIIYPKLEMPIKFLSMMPFILLFLLNDWRTETNKRLKNIEQGLNNPAPPTFDTFPVMEKIVKDTLKDVIAKGGKIEVQVISISAQFCSTFFQRVITELFSEQPNNLDLNIGIVVTQPEHLNKWELYERENHSRHSIKTLDTFLVKHEKQMRETGITLSLYKYDNIPHWHGVMINKNILFLGRTEWYKDGDDEVWELKVGEVEYRRFENEDTYGGRSRINRFDLWFHRYLDRARKNEKIHSNDDQQTITQSSKE